MKRQTLSIKFRFTFSSIIKIYHSEKSYLGMEVFSNGSSEKINLIKFTLNSSKPGAQAVKIEL
jgi:hypothetical protein